MFKNTIAVGPFEPFAGAEDAVASPCLWFHWQPKTRAVGLTVL